MTVDELGAGAEPMLIIPAESSDVKLLQPMLVELLLLAPLPPLCY